MRGRAGKSECISCRSSTTSADIFHAFRAEVQSFQQEFQSVASLVRLLCNFAVQLSSDTFWKTGRLGTLKMHTSKDPIHQSPEGKCKLSDWPKLHGVGGWLLGPSFFSQERPHVFSGGAEGMKFSNVVELLMTFLLIVQLHIFGKFINFFNPVTWGICTRQWTWSSPNPWGTRLIPMRDSDSGPIQFSPCFFLSCGGQISILLVRKSWFMEGKCLQQICEASAKCGVKNQGQLCAPQLAIPWGHVKITCFWTLCH